MNLESILAFALGLAVLGACIALSLHLSKRGREASARAVAQVDAALRAFAEQTGDRFEDGGGYSHPMVGFIPYSGRVVGARGALRFSLFVSEDEGSYELFVSVTPVPGKARRLGSSSADLAPRAQALVAALRAVCSQIAIEKTAPGSFNDMRVPSEIEFELVCRSSATLVELLASERLSFLLENALALADALSGP